MRKLVLIAASVTLTLASCANWTALNTDDMLGDAKERSAQTSAASVQSHWQEETFGGLAEFVGQTFRGEPLTADGAPNPDASADIQKWSWSDDGKEVIIEHGLEDGSYGGVTRVYPEEGVDNALGYTYVTSAGFTTEGVFTLGEDGSWEAIEEVRDHPTIRQVRSRGYGREDGALISEAEYLTKDGWVPGHGFVYTVFEGDVPKVVTVSE